MENVKMNGFTELSATEMESVDGGIAWVPVLVWIGKKAAVGAVLWGGQKLLDWAFD